MPRLERLLDNIRLRGAAACLYADGRWATYLDLDARVQCWRTRLDDALVSAGTVIGIRSDYSLDAIALLLAAWDRRLTVALIPRSGDHEAFLTDASAAGCFTFAADGNGRWEPREVVSGDRHSLLASLADAGEAGLVIFTSGSTGTAKAALHRVERFLGKFDRTGRPLRTLALLQFDHVAGVDTLLYTLSAGGSLVATARRDPLGICDLVQETGVQVLSTSPSFLRLLWASGASVGRNLSSVQVVTYGSEPMDPVTLQHVRQIFPGARLSQKYGTTEIGAPRTASRADDSLWIRIEGEGVAMDVRDGILWIRSDGAFAGYLNAPSPIGSDGWYCTGDLVERDGPWIRVLGRGSDLINVGGEKVCPVEVEQVILELDEIAAVAVTGAAHPLMGQIAVARVELAAGADPATIESQVRRHCRGRLARHKVPVTVDVAAAGSLGSDRQKVMRRQA